VRVFNDIVLQVLCQWIV